jgi:hypothetical protein
MNPIRALMRHRHWMLACVLACVAAPVSAEQELWRSDTTEPEVQDYSLFGIEIAIEGNVMAVGAPAHATDDPHPGAVYFFERQEDGLWQEVLKLTAPDASDSDWFGFNIAIDGRWVAITVSGVYSETESAVHVFRRGETASDWSHVTRLDAAGPIAMSGRRLVTRGRNNDVYLFERDDDGEWLQVHTFAGQEGTHWRPGDVTIDGDTVVIGSRGYGGLVYEYDGSNWLLSETLQVYDDGNDEPVTVATEDDVIVIGAPMESSDRRNLLEGRAHLYERQTGSWNHVAELGDHDDTVMRRFGYTLHFQDGIIVIGEPNRTGGRTVYMRNASSDWQRVAEMWVGLHETVGIVPEVIASADTFAVGMPANLGPRVIVWPFDEWLEDHAVEGADTGDTSGGDGDSDGDNNTGDDDASDGDETGNDDSEDAAGNDEGDNGDGNTGDNDAGEGDEIGNDDSEDVAGGDEGDDEGGDEGSDSSDADEGETGGDAEGEDEASGDETPPQSNSGGAALGWFIALLLAPLFSRRLARRVRRP